MLVSPPKSRQNWSVSQPSKVETLNFFKLFFLHLPFKFIQIPLKVVFILEKSRLYFGDDLPVIPVFFQPECRARPEYQI